MAFGYIRNGQSAKESHEQKEDKKMKKILAWAAAAALALSMTACGSTSSGSQLAGSTGGEGGEGGYAGTTLTVGIWGGNDQEAAAINQVKADFEALTGCTVELKTYTDYNTQIQADFIGKTAPDVFYVDGNMFPFYSQLGVMEPLDPAEMEADKYYENLIGAFTAEDGTLYCIPKDVSTLALYYNIDLLEEAGYTADDIPATYEEMPEFLSALQAKMDELYGPNQIAAMTYNQDLSRNIPILTNGGAEICDAEGNSTLSNPDVVANLEFMLNFVHEGLWKTPADMGLGWNGEVFGTGKAVIMEEGNWVYGTLVKDYSDINFGVKTMPTYKGVEASMSFTVGYGIFSGSENKELAKEWIKYACGIDGMNTWCSDAGCLPSRPDVAEAMDVESDPVWAMHSEMTSIAIPWQMEDTCSIINSAYQNFLPLAVSGEMSAEEAMVQADQQANSEIANAG